MNGLAAAVGVIPAFVIVGLVVLLTTRAAARGDLVRGGLVGIRTRATTRSDAAWVVGHRAAERPARWCALVCAASAVVVLGLALVGVSEQVVLIAAAVGGVAMVVMLLVATRRANTAAAAAQDGPASLG